MIQQLEIDGVPTLLAPGSGPMRAGLIFRVGSADETLARRGITHLLEHLALATIGQADYHYNGATDQIFTHFHNQGSEAHVAGFLTGVCESLQNLPMQRLEVEKEILRTEESSRGTGVMDGMPLWRHGAQDYGLVSYREFGLHMIGPDDLRAWAGRYFTRQNAVCWIVGDRVPEGLRLPLPSGERRPVPAASSALPQTPAYYASGSRAVALDAVVRAGRPAAVFAGVLERELFRTLRQEQGLSYTADAAYDWRGDEYAHIRALADALPEKQDAVLGGFVDVLAKLRVGRIEQADLDATVAKMEESLTDVDVDAKRLPSYALDLLVGRPTPTVDDLRAEIKAVTLDDLRAVAGELTANALLMVPDGLAADWAGYVAAPTRSTAPVPGTPHASREGTGQLLIGAEGVSYVPFAGDGVAAVRFAECAAMLCWPDGGRRLIGNDGIAVTVEPNLYYLTPEALRAVDQLVPPDRKVFLPPRDPEDIPVAGEHVALATGPKKPAGALHIIGMLLSAVGATLCAGFAALLAVALLMEPGDDELWIMVVVMAVFAAVLALPIPPLWRRIRSS